MNKYEYFMVGGKTQGFWHVSLAGKRRPHKARENGLNPLRAIFNNKETEPHYE